ncbi:MAG: PLP-dependent aminotransferase family protein, partial [Myxococcota bacterium]
VQLGKPGRNERALCGPSRDPSPSSRSLATSLGVHRNTVLAAYDELTAQGWITTRPAKGTFVSAGFPELNAETKKARSKLAPASGYSLPEPITGGRVPAVGEALRLDGGLPDSRLIPANELSRAYRRALRVHGRTLLDYGNPEGLRSLRVALVEMLRARRGITANEDCVLITRGSQMALYLAARVLLRPGDTVAVESFGYRPAWEALRLGGASLLPIPVDAGGLETKRLISSVKGARKRETESVRAIYVTPHHQYPTTATLSATRRMELLSFARDQRCIIIEDDYDHEFHYDGRPVLPLASSDGHRNVVYIGTMSKVLAPGLRLGFVVAPPPVIEQLANYRSCIDYHGDHVVEAAVAELIEDGELQRHMNRTRRIYEARRDCLVESLDSTLGNALSFTRPSGGMALWCRVNLTGSVDAWAKRATKEGVSFSPASRFTFDGAKQQFARFGFAAIDEKEIRRAVQILAKTAPTR